MHYQSFSYEIICYQKMPTMATTLRKQPAFCTKPFFSDSNGPT